MKNENGTGTVFKVSGKRRKPFFPLVTVGFQIVYNDDHIPIDLKQIRKTLTSFEKRRDALELLNRYNKILSEREAKLNRELTMDEVLEIVEIFKIKNESRRDFRIEEFRKFAGMRVPTFEEIWNVIVEKKSAEVSNNSLKSYQATSKKYNTLMNVPVNLITFNDVQGIIDKAIQEGASKSLIAQMLTVINFILDYSFKHGYIENNFYSLLEGGGVKADKKLPFTTKQMEQIFSKRSDHVVYEIMTILIFTGMRINELLKMKVNDIHLKERYMVGGSKTEAGKNRAIPIHQSIVPIIENRMKYSLKGKLYDVNYDSFRSTYKKLDLPLSSHAGRHTFITLMRNTEGIDEGILKEIVGHSHANVTDRVYTDFGIERLIREIDKFPISLK